MSAIVETPQIHVSFLRDSYLHHGHRPPPLRRLHDAQQELHTHTHKAPAASYTPWSVKRKGWQRGDNRKPVRRPCTIGAVCRSPEREVQPMKGVERENNKRDELKPSCTFTWLPS